MVVTYKDWHGWLPYALYAYQITIRKLTGVTSYSLVYGMEAVMLLKVAKIRYEQLNMIIEKRLVAIYHH